MSQTSFLSLPRPFAILPLYAFVNVGLCCSLSAVTACIKEQISGRLELWCFRIYQISLVDCYSTVLSNLNLSFTLPFHLMC